MIKINNPRFFIYIPHIFLNKFTTNFGYIPDDPDAIKEYRDEEIIVICHSGSRSMMAAQILAQAGFKDVRNLIGGIMIWHRKGYPVKLEEERMAGTFY